ncbi:hypothetical protein PSPO01_07998 [Paraphaeosphaeria sporulosa]
MVAFVTSRLAFRKSVVRTQLLYLPETSSANKTRLQYFVSSLTHNARPWDSQLTLNHDPSTGRATYLQRWDPNTEKQT